jgi:hypothetical protein
MRGRCYVINDLIIYTNYWWPVRLRDGRKVTLERDTIPGQWRYWAAPPWWTGNKPEGYYILYEGRDFDFMA